MVDKLDFKEQLPEDEEGKLTRYICSQSSEKLADYMNLTQKVITGMEEIESEIIKFNQEELIKKNMVKNLQSGNVDAAISMFKKDPFFAKEVYENLDKFNPDDAKKLIDLIIEKKFGWMLLEHLNKIDHKERKSIVFSILEKADLRSMSMGNPNDIISVLFGVLHHMQYIPIDEQMDVMKHILKKHNHSSQISSFIINDISYFDPSLHKEIIKLLIEDSLDEHLGEKIVKEIKNITGMTKTEVLLTLAENYWMARAVDKHLSECFMLDSDIAVALLKSRKGYHRYSEAAWNLSHNLKSFDAKNHDFILNAIDTIDRDIQTDI